MSNKKIIEVQNPAGLPTISWEKLKKDYEPNALKAKKNRDVGNLKDAILQMGFIIPLFIWEKGKYITDGAGRFVALEMLEYEGYEIPDLPYVPVQAKNKTEAKRITLAISSQYGNVTEDSIGEFTLDMHEIDLSFINVPGYNLEEIDWKPAKEKTPKEDTEAKGKTKHQHTCPECGTKFTS